MSKFLLPRRWDLIVFQYPEDPSEMYLKRLVGLPGETVSIRDGDVWIDGNRAVKPAEIAGIKFLAEADANERAEGGPWRLGDKEYFVLGDFSARSKDSRHWRSGALGHPPYAVPESQIEGVVTHIYWPPARIRSFR